MASPLTTSVLQGSTSTPIRATTSNLSLRAAPSVPPASQAYEPLVKHVLRRRLVYHLFPYSAAFTWALVVITSIWMQGGVSEVGVVATLLQPVRPSTIAITVLSWTLGAIPIVVLRKRYSSAAPTPATSPSQIFHTAWNKPTTTRALLTYISSAFVLTLLHILAAYTYQEDPRLSLFVKSKKHPYYLNGRLLYLLSSQLLVASVYLLRNILLDRFTVRWNSLFSPNAHIQNFRLARVLIVGFTLVLLATLNTAVHTFLFGLARLIALPALYKLPLIPRLLRPFTSHFLRGPYSLVLLLRNGPLIARAFALSFSTLAIWEFAESVFDHVVSEPVTVSQTTADPALTIISGTTSSDLYFKHFAYNELVHFANEDSDAARAQRSALFADQKYNPSMWSTLVRESLITLGKDYQLLLRRGKPEAPAPAAAPTALKAPPPPPGIPQTPLLRTSVFKPSSQQVIRQARDALAGRSLARDFPFIMATGENVPELFRSVLHAPPSQVVSESSALKKSEEEMKKMAKTLDPKRWKTMLLKALETQVEKVVPKRVVEGKQRLGRWWTRERVNKVVECAVPNRKLDALAIQALSQLVCHSLTEDKYGVVQRDIPRILEAMISFLTAIEEYRTELQTKYPTPSADDLAHLPPAEVAQKEKVMIELATAGDVLGEVDDALKNGLVRIVQTFGERLSAFRFPPRIAKILQEYVDYT
ncbi:unnamed protein product [Somion occarium]|uniref:Nucleoporin NDC1 n=1 Tax=Somion occarium TaxID=3059160 RepID=A0ABP1DRD1_9APHY